MRKVVTLLLIILAFNAYPQGLNDSLLNLLKSAGEADRVGILMELCWENRFNNPAEALSYGLEALTLVKKYEQYEYEPAIYNYLGIIQRNVGDLASALEYFLNARDLAGEHQNQEQLGYANNNIGDVYNQEAEYGLALKYEMTALLIFEELGDSVGISYCCHQIALVYSNMGEYMEALEYHRRSMNIRAYLGNEPGVGYSLISIGETWLELGNYEKSLESLERSRDIFIGLNDPFGLTQSLHAIGEYYNSQGQKEEAIRYFTEALNLAKENGSQIHIRNAAQELSEIYAEREQYKEAYQMYTLYKETYDSLYREENFEKLTQLVLRNEFEQREILQLAEIDRQKQVRNYLILSIALVFILAIVIYSRFQIKKKANIKLQKQNVEIESQKDYLAQLNDDLEHQTTELNQTLKHLTQAQTQLVQAEKMASLGQVTAGVAHELNNPLNFISTSVKPLRRNVEDLISVLEKYESLVEGKLCAEVRSAVEAFKDSLDYSYILKETQDLLSGIYEGASRSEHIVRDLRTFSRMDENEFKPVNIHEGIDSTLLLLSNKLKDRITVHKNYGEIPPVECLPGKLNQVFMNILTNSILAIEDQGEIHIETGSLDEKVRITIRDTGMGMSDKVMEHIFEPFFTTRPVGKGTGLGLSITYSIIEEHHGNIQVNSTPGEGTEFIITIPFQRKGSEDS
jgi:signal transduction histidine kinase